MSAIMSQQAHDFPHGHSEPTALVADDDRKGSREVGSGARWSSCFVCVLLAFAVWAIYGQTRHHDFVNYDDDTYVYKNAVVTNGFSLAGVNWAFSHTVSANWHPLTVMSHMLDCQLWGLNPAGHHLINVLLHAVTAMVFFLVFRSMTGLFWPAAFVAVVFAIHPLRVESVAWVAERKDVLSGLFFMLTLWVYVRYARQSKTSPYCLESKVWYGLALGFFALGLMSKPMLVTLPFILLLLDYWPLERFGQWRRLVLEKIPFLLLTVAAVTATLLAQKFAIESAQPIGFPWRIGNALVSYVAYIGQMFYPVGLAPFYPHPGNQLPIWQIALSLLTVIGISAGVLVMARQQPCLVLGWLWYLGMLVPVIGLVQVGDQARADRYTYLPQIGLYIMIACGGSAWCGQRPWRRRILASGSVLILAGLLALAHTQTTYWKNSTTLWTHTLACTSGNYLAHYNLGVVLTTQRKTEEAISQYEQALQFKPDYADAHINLANALADLGKSDEAIQHYERALQLTPNAANVHNDLGTALADEGRFDEAIQQYEQALRLKPDYANAHFNLGIDFAAQGKLDEAISHYEQALRLKPEYAEAHCNLGNVLVRQRKLEEAVSHYRDALQIEPDYTRAHINIGIVLANQGKLPEARNHLEQALDQARAQNNVALIGEIQALLRKITRLNMSQTGAP